MPPHQAVWIKLMHTSRFLCRAESSIHLWFTTAAQEPILWINIMLLNLKHEPIWSTRSTTCHFYSSVRKERASFPYLKPSVFHIWKLSQPQAARKTESSFGIPIRKRSYTTGASKTLAGLEERKIGSTASEHRKLRSCRKPEMTSAAYSPEAGEWQSPEAPAKSHVPFLCKLCPGLGLSYNDWLLSCLASRKPTPSAEGKSRSPGKRHGNVICSFQHLPYRDSEASQKSHQQ